MPEVEKSSMLEKISGNLVTEGALTAIGTLAAFPLAPLLPVLSNSLANRRHKQRVENALQELRGTFFQIFILNWGPESLSWTLFQVFILNGIPEYCKGRLCPERHE